MTMRKNEASLIAISNNNNEKAACNPIKGFFMVMLSAATTIFHHQCPIKFWSVFTLSITNTDIHICIFLGRFFFNLEIKHNSYKLHILN